MNPTIHFQIRLDRPAKDGSVPIYLVFLIDRKHRTKISIGKSVPLKPEYKTLSQQQVMAMPAEARRNLYAWNESIERLMPATHPTNRVLDKEKARAIAIVEKFELMERPITIELFQNAFCKPSGSNSFCEYFEKEVLEKRKSVLSAGTLKNFSTTISKICKFRPNLTLADVTYKFLSELENYMLTPLTEKGLGNNQNTVSKTMSIFVDNQGTWNSTVNTINSVNNYSYDKIGNLVKDSAEGIATISWTVYGKIKSVTHRTGYYRMSGTDTVRPADLVFNYDAAGNRISKVVKPRTATTTLGDTSWTTTHYVRDAQGNVLSVYTQKDSAAIATAYFKQTEKHVYGSSRLGIDQTSTELLGATFDTDTFNHKLGNRSYELSNHLGNVLTTISDKRIALDTNANDTIDYYVADIRSATDYAAFGAPLEGRTWNSGASSNGFGGKRKESELYGEGNAYDFDARMYDSRVGRWLSMDPSARRHPEWSPYKAFNDAPLIFSDPNGADEFLTIVYVNEKTGETKYNVIKVSDEVFTDNVKQMAGDNGSWYYQKNWCDKNTTVVMTKGQDGKVTTSSTSILMKDKVKATTAGPLINSSSYAMLKSNLMESDNALDERMKVIAEKLAEEYGGSPVHVKDPVTEGGPKFVTALLSILKGEIGDVYVNTGTKVDEDDRAKISTPEQVKKAKEGDTLIGLEGNGEGDYWLTPLKKQGEGVKDLPGKATEKQVKKYGSGAKDN